MLSDIKNLYVMLGGDHFGTSEKGESLNSNLARRPGSTISNGFENDQENIHVHPRVINSGNCTQFDHNSATADSSAAINRLSSELNSRLSRELDEMMGSVNAQIQRAISDASSNQILPQIQTALNAGSGHLTQNRWNVPSQRPGVSSEETYGEKAKKNARSEQRVDYQNVSQPQTRAYNMVTGENESPIHVPEFLTGRMPSRNHLNQSYDDLNLYTTIPAQDRPARL